MAAFLTLMLVAKLRATPDSAQAQAWQGDQVSAKQEWRRPSGFPRCSLLPSKEVSR